MALIGIENMWGRYKFTLNKEVIDAYPNNFVFNFPWTNRDQDDYRITNMGKDSGGFYYTETYYTFIGTTRYVNYTNKIYWNVETSGDFIIEFSGYSYPNTEPPYLPEEIYNGCCEFIDIEFNPSQEHIIGEMVGYGYDATGSTTGVIGEYIELLITPIDSYKFIDDDIPIIVSIPDSENGGYKDVTLTNNRSVTPNWYTITELRQDGKLHVFVILGSSYSTLSKEGYDFVSIGILTDKIIKGSYDVELSLDNITPSNPSTSASTSETYTNVLTANTGYTMDDVDVVVTMNGNVINAYNPTTHTITINQVTGDIVISASSKKLHTFRFYSSDGTILRATITAHSITDILITLIGNTRTLKVKDVTIATYTQVIPSDHELVGLSLEVNSNRPLISLGYTFEGDFVTDTDFYECVTEIPVISDDLTINLYHNRSKKDILNKQLDSVGNLVGTLREQASILTPSIMIEYQQLINFDYVYIPKLKRYYYVTNVISVRKNLWIIELRVDVLKTYDELIRLQTCYVLRNQYEYDNDKTDMYVSFDYDKKIIYEYVEYDDEIFNFNDIDDNSFRNFILKVISVG